MSDELGELQRAATALKDGLRRQVERPAFRPLNVTDLVADAPAKASPVGRFVGVAAAVAAIATAGVLLVPNLGEGPVPAAPAPSDPHGGPVSVPAAAVTWPEGVWTKVAASPLSPRWEPSGVWVDGRYLVVGGYSDFMCPPSADCVDHELLADGALFDPTTNTWTTIASLPQGAYLGHAAALGSSAYFLTWPTVDADAVLLRYDLAADSWTSYPLAGHPGGGLVATDTRVLVLSGTDEYGVVDDLAFDPASGEFATLPDDPLGPSFSRSAVWLGDRLLLGAKDLVANPGSEKPSLLRLAELDADLTTWKDLGTAEILGSPAFYANGRVIAPELGSADGGEVNNWGRAYPYGGILDPATGEWTDLPTPPPNGGLNGASLTVADRVAIGSQLLDPVTLRWTSVPQQPGGEPVGQVVLGGDTAVFAWGGGDYETPSATGYLFVVPAQAQAPSAVPLPSSAPPETAR